MKRHVVLALLTVAVVVFAAEGCINMQNVSYIEGGGGGAAGSTSSSGGNGNGGTGGACTCADDGNECTDDLVGQGCPNGDEKACHTPALGRPCMNGAKTDYCDAQGACSPCKDCADATCTHRCVGWACAANEDCANGKCVDGFCCDSDCTGPCNACNRVPGTCSPLPVGMRGECTGVLLCDNMGSCTAGGAPLGALCNGNAACASGTCVAQICVSPNGQPCVEDLECASRLCDPTTHTCIACGGAVLCPDGAGCLANGSCRVLLGQPATNSNECVPSAMVNDQLTCTLGVGVTCKNDFECIFHDCNGAPNGTCAGACTTQAECTPGTTCDTARGWCRLPPGSFCVIDDQCQGPVNVGTCSGFPRRCQ